MLLTGVGFLIPPTALGEDTPVLGWRLLSTVVAALACELYGWILIHGIAGTDTDDDVASWFGPAVWSWRVLAAAMAVGMLFPSLARFGAVVVTLVAVVLGGLGVATLVKVFRGSRRSIQVAAAVLVGGCGLAELGFVGFAVWGIHNDPDWLAVNSELVTQFVTVPVAVTIAIAGILGLWLAWRDKLAGREPEYGYR
ncbi:hypothetical protein ACFO5K_03985 [Nocardia halotolerans]|uniref:Uncharacterized protein n=1 Tax=Nocardia halotolerans TaxID=1755878 RepID=A0ABV8VD47_9NOCA